MNSESQLTIHFSHHPELAEGHFSHHPELAGGHFSHHPELAEGHSSHHPELAEGHFLLLTPHYFSLLINIKIQKAIMEYSNQLLFLYHLLQ